MKLIYAVKDRATDAFWTPMFYLAKGQALRQFQDEVNNPAEQNPLHKHPDDYDLYHLGAFDDQTGAIQANERPELAARGKDVYIKEQ
ncbi:MAG: nonstructural protein [Microvirus sp.]|nr:MAG: nonstructural protein [Microvirus sp.]